MTNEGNLKFKKSIKNNQNNNFSSQKNRRNQVKLRIMTKYNISAEEAERILSTLESRRPQNEVSNRNPSRNIQPNHGSQQRPLSKSNEKYSRSPNLTNAHPNPHVEASQSNTLENSKNTADNTFTNHSSKKSTNVDDIIGGIVPGYNQQISIDVNHVDLTFEVQNEKIDTLKETFIRAFSRKKSNKIKVHALKDVSFKIYQGEKVGIIGYNGAGKSTLLNVITGIYSPDKGSVITRGNISPLLSLGAGFDHNFSGRKNIILNGAVLGYDKEYLESKIDEIIEFSELGEFIDIPIKNYSSGMMAKLGFSIATAVEPDILIIDEILGVGDVNFQKKSGDKMRSLMDGGTTVLLVSHSIPQIRELCDKAIWIDNGRLREMGEVNKVCDHYLKDAEKASNEQLANIQFR